MGNTVSPDERHAIQLDALRALAGADEVRKRLLAALAMGNPSLESQAYLIKSRVKTHEGIVEKVVSRKTRRPDYSADDVTDIVGLRLLSLYRNELPALLMGFLNFVEWSQRYPILLFSGSKLFEAIKEVIIYPVADSADVTTSLMLREFAQRGFAIRDLVKTEQQTVEKTVYVQRKDSRYSSVHLVLWCTGIAKNAQFRIPLEVQLRSSLEDTWGEIEHRLKYKAATAGGNEIKPEHKQAYEDTTVHLKSLKHSLDACAEQADHIQQQVRRLFDDVSYETRQNIKSVSVDIERLAEFNLDREIQDKLDDVVKSLGGIYRKIYSTPGWPATDVVASALDIFTRAAATFAVCLQKYLEVPSSDAKTDDEIQYRLRMEKALCLYWRAFLMNGALSRKLSDSASAEQVASAIKEALQEYSELSRDPRYANDALLAFRIANALALRGDSSLALSEYREAARRLKDDRRLSQRHYMRVRIPRQLGVALWAAAEAIKQSSAELGDKDFLSTQRQELYLEAFEVTRPIYGLEIDEGPLDRRLSGATNESDVTANNLLDYAVCYLNAGGRWEELQKRDFDKDFMNRLLNRIMQGGVTAIERVTIADTVRSVARYLGDRPLATAAARRVLELVKARDLGSFLPDSAYDEIRRDAEEELGEET